MTIVTNYSKNLRFLLLRENNLQQQLNRFPVILTMKPSFIDPRELT